MNNEIYIKKLNIIQIISVYNRSLKKEFPSNERRPLVLIIKGVIAGTYECLGAFCENELLGYAFFLKYGNDYLWDYLAVFENYRCGGVGSKIIHTVKEYYKSADSVIGEVENPEFAKTDEEKKIMSRRLNFYLRNGCADTGVKAVTFGAHFIIIQISGKSKDTLGLAELYKTHYRVSLPKRIYEGNIETY